jgi:hypothetical protein
MRFARYLFFFLAFSAFAANIRLYLKDGDYQVVREYKVESDRVRYYSVERGDWEEIPLALVDVKRTEAEVGERKAAIEQETKLLTAEDKAERERANEIARVPQAPGVHLVVGDKIHTMKPAESEMRTSKGRSILKVMAPIPIVSGKGTVELKGEHSLNKVASERPEFYISLSAEERFGMIRLKPEKNSRIVERLTMVPITNEVVEQQDTVEIFRQQVDTDLYKIWPVKPLEPGEYAVVEYTEGKVNIQVWDFAYDPKAVDPLDKPAATKPADKKPAPKP